MKKFERVFEYPLILFNLKSKPQSTQLPFILIHWESLGDRRTCGAF